MHAVMTSQTRSKPASRACCGCRTSSLAARVRRCSCRSRNSQATSSSWAVVNGCGNIVVTRYGSCRGDAFVRSSDDPPPMEHQRCRPHLVRAVEGCELHRVGMLGRVDLRMVLDLRRAEADGPHPSRSSRPDATTSVSMAATRSTSTVAGSSPESPRITAVSVPWPGPVAPREPSRRTSMRWGVRAPPRAQTPWRRAWAPRCAKTTDRCRWRTSPAR